MRSVGFLLIILGVGPFVLHSMDREFKLLMWVDKWGTDTGNIIRVGAALVGAALVGAALVFFSMRKKASEE